MRQSILTSSSSRHVSIYRGWGYKGKHSEILVSSKDLSFSATIAISVLHFYGILINENSNDCFTFRYFLHNIIGAREKLFK